MALKQRNKPRWNGNKGYQEGLNTGTASSLKVPKLVNNSSTFFVGGLTAVFFTDVLQCTIMVIGGIVVAIMSK